MRAQDGSFSLESNDSQNDVEKIQPLKHSGVL